MLTDNHSGSAAFGLKAGGSADSSLNTAYKLVQGGRFPCEVLRVGSRYRVPAMGLMKALGIEQFPIDLDDVERGAGFAAGFDNS